MPRRTMGLARAPAAGPGSRRAAAASAEAGKAFTPLTRAAPGGNRKGSVTGHESATSPGMPVSDSVNVAGPGPQGR